MRLYMDFLLRGSFNIKARRAQQSSPNKCWHFAEELTSLPRSTSSLYFSMFGRPSRKSVFRQPWVLERESWKSSVLGMEVSKLDLSIPLLWDRRAVYRVRYRKMWCQERNGQLYNFCEKNETTSASLPTRPPCRNLYYLFWSETPTDGLEPDRNFQPWAQKKRLYRFKLSKLVSGDSEAIRVQCKSIF